MNNCSFSLLYGIKCVKITFTYKKMISLSLMSFICILQDGDFQEFRTTLKMPLEVYREPLVNLRPPCTEEIHQHAGTL